MAYQPGDAVLVVARVVAQKGDRVHVDVEGATDQIAVPKDHVLSRDVDARKIVDHAAEILGLDDASQLPEVVATMAARLAQSDVALGRWEPWKEFVAAMAPFSPEGAATCARALELLTELGEHRERQSGVRVTYEPAGLTGQFTLYLTRGDKRTEIAFGLPESVAKREAQRFNDVLGKLETGEGTWLSSS